jgi:hypothetical protein
MLPLSAMSETYKCRSPDGKISYSGQMSLAPGVKCEQPFVKKQSVVVQETPPAPPETTVPTEMAPQNLPPADGGETQPPATNSKPTNTNNKKVEPDAAKKPAAKTTPEKSAADKQAELKLKEDNCQSAKVNLRTYQAGGRISKVNENGEKVPMDDAEVQQKAQEAQAAVDKWCGS